MCGEVHNGVVGEPALLGKLFDFAFGRAATKENVALRHSQAAADLAQLIRRLGQRRPQTYVLDIGPRAAEQGISD